MSEAATAKTGGRTLFGHPIGLVNLFGVELWERFSFYGMLTILGYYLYYETANGGLGIAQDAAVGLVGAYGGLVYLSTILGGWVSDRLIGMERTVFYGGVVVMAGHIALAVLPGPAGVGSGLVLVALGSGALKANASALLGTLYEKGDPRVDGGFTLFYLGINVGGFTGPLLTGLLQREWGFHAGFGAAAVGMALGLLQYVVFRRNLGAAGRVVPDPLPRKAFGPLLVLLLVVILGIALLVVAGMVTVGNLPDVTTVLIIVAAAGYFAVLLTHRRVTGIERTRVRAFIPLFVANVVFWALFQQVFTVLAVYSDERIDWNIFGWTAPSNWVGSADPVWIVVLSPLFAVLWTKLGGRAPSTPRKFAFGVMGIGATFLLFVPLAGTTGRTVPALLVLFLMAGFAISELLIAPIGLAVTTQLSPEHFRAQMMALYFLSVALGTTLSGVLARFYSPDTEFAYFGITGSVALVVGVVIVAISPMITRYMSGVH